MPDRHVKLRILSPTGVTAEAECDIVQLVIPDDSTGHHGGSIGIEAGHASAVMVLAEGDVDANMLDGSSVLHAHVQSGFASVADDLVTVLSDSAVVEKTE